MTRITILIYRNSDKYEVKIQSDSNSIIKKQVLNSIENDSTPSIHIRNFAILQQNIRSYCLEPRFENWHFLAYERISKKLTT